MVQNVPDSKLKITTLVKEDIFYFRRLTLQKQPVRLSFLAEAEQLAYWKQAVRQSRKEPRQLQIAGLYNGIPYDCVENLKIKASPSFQGSRCQLKNIALLNDSTENKVLVVVT